VTSLFRTTNRSNKDERNGTMGILDRIHMADAEDKAVKEFLKNRWPDWSAPKYAPQAMIPQLNTFGEKGWELVHMKPVVLGKDNDVIHSFAGTAQTHVYFCVFKRVKQ
jgi:hypothetical protein